MATLRREFFVLANAERVWAVLRDFGAVHEKLAPGFVTDCRLEEDGAVRALTFYNGMQARERLVAIDDAAMRLVYTAEGGRATHHNASAQVIATGENECRFVWITDLLPDQLAQAVGSMMDAGAKAMQAALERR
jgi:carbon monoxide dehydrogenase subunit G